MSKAQLKKELQTLDKDQLIEVLLSTYSASAGAKEYLEFFLNPDENGLMEKKLKVVDKELSRTKYGYSKARISVLNKTLKEFASFGVPAFDVARFALQIFIRLIIEERWTHFSPTLVAGTAKMLAAAMIEGAKAQALDKVLDTVRDVYRDPKIGREGFKAYFPAWIRLAVTQLPPNTELPEFEL